ncbi:MAG: PAS domain S-box protein [Nitrospirae bacterium]|nr:PAS domain S-box protein [Nitrospirota bacterium]
MEQWFRHNLDYVFLVYGLAFVVMGILIFAQNRDESVFKLSGIIGLLGAFAFIHGMNEWFDMLQFIHPSVKILKILGWICLVTSFSFLFEFGRRILAINKNKTLKNISSYLSWWITPIILVAIFVVSYTSDDGLNSGQIVTRYFLAFPGSIFTAIGFYFYRNDDVIIRRLRVTKYFLLASVSFLMYAFWGGLFVPKGTLFISSVLNADAFLSFVHIPVQLFRAITAVIITISIVGVLKLFNWESKRQLQDSYENIAKSKERIVYDAKIQEVINNILKISLLPISLEEQLKQILNLIMSVSWISLQSKGCIYVCVENSNVLKIMAYHNFNAAHLDTCKDLPFGECLCGLVAATKNVVFVSTAEDVKHTLRYKDMQPHGHYCIPIVSNDRLLGVINVYLNEGHKQDIEEEGFLTNVANTIAGIILRKVAEAKIFKEKMFSEKIISLLPGIFYLFDSDGRYISWNRNLEDVTGYSYEDIEKMKPEEFFIGESKKDVIKAIRYVFSTKENTSIEADMRTKDGRLIPCYFNGFYIELEEDKPCLIGIGLDISQRKNLENRLRDLNENLGLKVEQETEKRRQHEQLLIQQSKMASMGEMISIISHQWRQPLSALSTILQDLTDAYDYGELDKEYLNHTVDTSVQQIMFMSKTIDDFRKFLMPSKIKSEIDVKRAIEDILSMFSGIFKKDNITVTLYEDRADTYIATGYPNEFKQVILNIINNARDAILIGRDEGLLDRDYVGVIDLRIKKEQGKIILTIVDNGGGIPEDIIGKIFDPYFTTKSTDSGTGIGLYMSKTIIENNMGWKLNARNIAGGAEFRIEI